MSGLMIAARSLDDVKRRADILTVASRFTNLKRSGVEYVGLCPYPDHDDKTPSFSVSPNKGVYLCRGCERGGDAITLVRELSSLDFIEAVEHLADIAGIEVEYDESSSEDAATHAMRREVEDGARKLMGHAAVVWCRNLLDSTDDDARLALDYLTEERKLSVETIKAFRIGYIPDEGGAAVRRLARELGVSDESVELSGLLNRGDRPVFGGRITFPITDAKGRTRGFGGRLVPGSALQEAVDADEFKTGKYINSRDSRLFSKGSLLYGLARAQEGIRRGRRAVVAEGYMDVVALHQAGVTEAVATLGTAMTKDHFRLLAPNCDTVYLVFDPDEAGVKAIDRARRVCETGSDLRVVALDEDPADWLCSHSMDEFEELVAAAPGAIEYLIEDTAASVEGEDYRARAKMLNTFRELLAEIENSVVRKELERRAAEALQVSVKDVRLTSGKKRQKKTKDTHLVVSNAPLYLADRIEKYPTGQPIYIVSHPRHADALVEVGYGAVSITTGHDTCPSPEVLEVLRGRNVWLWPESDDNGVRQAIAVKDALSGIASSVRLTAPDGMKPGEGAADHRAIKRLTEMRSGRKEET